MFTCVDPSSRLSLCIMNGDLSMLKSELSALVNLDSDISISGWAVEFATDSSLEWGHTNTQAL